MPTNQIVVELAPGGALSCEVWDKDGQVHDVTSSFVQIRGATSGGAVWSELMLKAPEDSLQTTLKFLATAKELKFAVSEKVVAQILEMQVGG